jgi:tRNA dimethylallyltransferase
MAQDRLIVITGPTAVGKTKLAVQVAAELGGELINADSRQVYRRMDIGTGKDLEDYSINGKVIPHHLINICEPGYQYNIKEYQQDFTETFNELQKSGTPAVLCGGSGLYIESALKGNPFAFIPVNQQLRDEISDDSKSVLINRIDAKTQSTLNITTLTTSKRLIRAVEISEYLRTNTAEVLHKPIEAAIYVLTLPRAVVLQRIRKRLIDRLENGMIEEVDSLLKEGLQPEQLIYYGLEYRWVTLYLLNELTYDEMVDRLNISIRQFAKRQMTWFRRMEKKGYKLNWLDGTKDRNELAASIISQIRGL